MILSLSGEIIQDSFEKLIKSINELKEKEKLIVYFNSDGGDVGYMRGIIDLINQNVDLIEMVGYRELLSAGFDIFFKTNCHKILLPGTIGMSHISKGIVQISEDSNTVPSYKKALKEFLNQEKVNAVQFYKSLGMASGEISKIIRGEDVYFQPKRMNELLNYQKSNARDFEYIH